VYRKEGDSDAALKLEPVSLRTVAAPSPSDVPV
jgi:hypothetical protein